MSRTGDHTQNALFLIAGLDVTPGQLPADARVEDVAATLAAFFDVSLDNVEGVPLRLRHT